MKLFTFLTGITLLLAAPAFAQDHAHAVTAGTITILHPWMAATNAGADGLVYLEIDNAGGPIELTGAQSAVSVTAELVGASMCSDGTMNFQPVGAVLVPSGDFDLDPKGLGILLETVDRDLVEGDTFKLEISFSNGEHVQFDVEVQEPGATQHSHAGHNH